MSIRYTLILSLLLATSADAETLTMPLDQRPEWLRREGIVMAGSWAPLMFRVRRDGSPGYTPTAEQLENYRREQSPEMIAELKALGVNFVMMHCYMGCGVEAERESMADCVRFARLCHEAGLHVGVYTNSGTLCWELLFKEIPQARDWSVFDTSGQPISLNAHKFRYWWNRVHPDAIAYHKNIVRFAIEEVKAELIHLDNYIRPPGHSPVSVERFREYLRNRFSPEQLERMGIGDPQTASSPKENTKNPFLHYAWLDFCCQALADSYLDMTRYARSLRPDILMEANPIGPDMRISVPVNHGLLLAGGEAFWDEGPKHGFRDGKLYTRIRTYKVGRLMNNMVFSYTITPLEMAESMAFNVDCLGCICWFEYGKVVSAPVALTPLPPEVLPYIRFFRTRRELFRDTSVVADVAVLRSFPSQVFADPKHAELNARVEQALIENRVPFQILYDNQLDMLKQYRALVLADCVAFSDQQLALLKQYTAAGGRLCVVGSFATHDEWMRPRETDALADFAPTSLVRISAKDEIIPAVRKSCADKLSLSVRAREGVCAELTELTDRRLVHLVNYFPETPVQNIAVELRLPAGKKVKSVTLADPLQDQDADLAFKEDDGTVTFIVPHIDVYGIASVSWR